ncbi:peptidoglycan/LPS O-acetylase OafA/YrhL [Saccharomonospora amisosensis]|uniref:Peptidoglycan/LPS O-acetylase OafA/YrhL n=1 Tax=Saccharomonospora amisosensis TaxID=1128677 RepID=A0A7X5UP17_9PSEU|nr:acyltransferase [Saccharomonospora amisosensis]NIJ11520.1 peptidoglycan/LPS O-acetylase OafA/YrhL [Saccharomonospora amisosensis]
MTTGARLGAASAASSQSSQSSQSSRSSRKLSWDLIRVVAIGFVVIGHVAGLASLVPGIAPYPDELRALRIPFGTVTLLVLSGYFVGPTLRRGDAGRWFRARLARLLPAYLTAVLITYVVTRLVVVDFNGWYHHDGLYGLLFAPPIVPEQPVPGALPPWHVPDLNDLLLNLLLLHEWNPDFYHRIDGSYWTLPVQVAAFAAAALLWRAGLRHRFRPHTVLWAVTLVSAASPALSLLFSTLPAGTGLSRAHLFAAGLAIWLWQERRLGSGHLAGLLLATLVLHAVWTSPPVPASVAGFAIMLVAMCFAARGPDWAVGPLARLRRPISWLAGISFGLYLVHQQLGYVVARLLTEAGVSAWWLRLTLVVGFAVMAAWLLTVLVERPAYRALTRPSLRAATAVGRPPSGSVGGSP